MESEKVKAERTVIFLHIPKTAGTTLTRLAWTKQHTWNIAVARFRNADKEKRLLSVFKWIESERYCGLWGKNT
jgi:hypothetical protein